MVEDDPDRVHVHAVVIVNADRGHATGDQDPRIAGKGTTKVGTADLEDINFRVTFVRIFIPNNLTPLMGRLNTNNIVPLRTKIYIYLIHIYTYNQ